MLNKIYEEYTELKDLAIKLHEKMFNHIGYVDLDKIYFAKIVDTEKPSKIGIMEISGIKSKWVKNIQLNTDNSIVYCIAVWFDDWTDLDNAMQEWMLFDALYTVSPFQEGELRPYDVTEHSVIADILGNDWRKKHLELPSILETEGDILPELYEFEFRDDVESQ